VHFVGSYYNGTYVTLHSSKNVKLKLMLEKEEGEALTGYNRLKTGTSGELFRALY